MASSVSKQDEPNHVLCLATRAGKMVLSCLVGFTPISHKKIMSFRPYYESFIDQACWINKAQDQPRSFLATF